MGLITSQKWVLQRKWATCFIAVACHDWMHLSFFFWKRGWGEAKAKANCWLTQKSNFYLCVRNQMYTRNPGFLKDFVAMNLTRKYIF